MNNKGFTLTELLAIVVIIVLVSLVAVPSMTKQIKKEEDQIQSILNNKIENAAKLYAVKYYSSELIKLTSGSPAITFSLNDLEKDGLINLQNKCNTDGKKNEDIEISYVSSKIQYNYWKIKDGNCYYIDENMGSYKK